MSNNGSSNWDQLKPQAYMVLHDVFGMFTDLTPPHVAVLISARKVASGSSRRLGSMCMLSMLRSCAQTITASDILQASPHSEAFRKKLLRLLCQVCMQLS